MFDIGKQIQDKKFSAAFDEHGDVPFTLKIGKKDLPLGRHLRERLRGLLGKEKTTPKEALEKLNLQMSKLFQSYLADPKNKNKTFRDYLAEVDAGKYASIVSKHKVWSKKGHI